MNAVSDMGTEPAMSHLFFFKQIYAKFEQWDWRHDSKLTTWAALHTPVWLAEAEDPGGEDKSILLILFKEMMVHLSSIPIFANTSSNCLSISGNHAKTMTARCHRCPDSAVWHCAWGNWAIYSTIPEGVKLNTLPANFTLLKPESFVLMSRMCTIPHTPENTYAW